MCCMCRASALFFFTCLLTLMRGLRLGFSTDLSYAPGTLWRSSSLNLASALFGVVSRSCFCDPCLIARSSIDIGSSPECYFNSRLEGDGVL